MKNFPFLEVFARVKESTEIKKYTQLADFLGITQQAVSNAKKKGHFPADWAVLLEGKYGILTRWILTGEGPARIETEKKQPEVYFPEFFKEFMAWAEAVSGKQDMEWLKNQLEICFPTFRMWKEQKKNAAALETGQIDDEQQGKVA